MDFKSNTLPTNILSTYIHIIIEGIIFFKNQKTTKLKITYLF